MDVLNIICLECGGEGEIEIEGVIGYITRDMAIDGGCREREGEAIYGKVKVVCEMCNGYGEISII